jgi:hypothetical protein
MLSHSNSVIDAREFIVISDENDGLREIQVIGFWVDGESLELRENLLWNRCISLFIFPPKEHILISYRKVDDKVAIGSFIGIGYVSGERVLGTKPLIGHIMSEP